MIYGVNKETEGDKTFIPYILIARMTIKLFEN